MGGKPNPITLRVLILEDRPEDAELMVRELRRSDFAPLWRRVETEPTFLAELRSHPPDVILSDFHLPQMEAPDALALLQGLQMDIPFIVVSGAIGEDVAVAIMRQGASDYLLKDRMMRLGEAVRRALQERDLRNERRDTEKALRASEARFYSFMNNSPTLAAIKDDDGHILYINNMCEQMWNIPVSECQGKSDSDLWPEDVAAGIRAHDMAVLTTGKPSRVVEQIPARDGSIRHFLVFRFPFADATERLLLGEVCVDITEGIESEKVLADALAGKEVLLREVHHRVKNNLQIISSLLNMQTALLPDPAMAGVFRESQQRVQAMAMIHERLYGQSDVQQLDFGDYVTTLARDLFFAAGADPRRIRLRLDLQPVSLELDQAIPCGLIFNELMTNSFKYAFPNGREGEVVITLTAGADNLIRLRVSDDGVGLPPGFDLKQSRTLGLKIIHILARQLDGVFLQDSGPGASFTLSFGASSK